MATVTNTSPSEDLTNVVIEPHGMRHVSMQHLDFRRRFLDKYGRCCSSAIDIKAVECTCKAIANLTGESTDEIAVVYGINIVKFQSIADLAVDIVNNCYMDAALDATKRLSTCIDIYYKNKDASLDHGGSGGDGEDGEDKVVISFTQNTSLEYNIENVLSPIVFSGDVTGSLDVTITPRNCNLSGFATDSNQKVPADMVYELPVHTLADINIELAALKCTPISLENVSIEFRVNGVLTKTISLQVRDASSLEVTMEESTVTVNKEGVVNPIIFTGELTRTIEVVVIPRNCSVSGFTSRPETVVSSGSSWSFNADTVQAINNELVALKVLAPAEGKCQLEVHYLDDVTTFDITVTPAQPSAQITFSLEDTTIILGQKTSIPAITATGNITDAVTFKVTPSHCAISGFASDPDKVFCANAAYSFVAADITSINNELANLQVLGSTVGTALLKISYLNQEQILNITVRSVPINVVVPTLDTCESLNELVESQIKPIVFKGKVEKDAVKVVVTPMNCTFKGVASNTEIVYTNDTPCTFVGNSLENLNTEFAQLKVTPLQTQNVLLNITIDDEPTNYQFSFLVIPKKYTTLSVSLNTGTQMNVNRWTEIPVVFSGEIIEDDLRQITISPKNCTLKGMKTNNQETTEPYSFTPVSIKIANEELAKLQIMPSSESETSISIQIENEESQKFIFSNIQPTPKTNLTASIDTSVELTVNRESTQTSFSFTGTIEHDDIRTVTITPTNCKFKVNDSIEYTNSNTYSKVVNSLNEINNELTNIKIIATAETNVLITVNTGGTDAPQIFTFTTINPAPKTKLNLSIDDDVELKVARETIVPLTFTGTIEPDDIRTVTVTPSECEIKTTGELSTSPISVEASTLEVLNDGFSNLTIKPSTQSATLSIDTEEPPIEIGGESSETIIQFNNIGPRPLTMLTPSVSTDTTLTEARPTNVDMSFSGSIEFDDIRQITITPTNTRMSIVDKNYENTSPLVINTYTELTDLNDQVKNMSLTPTSTSDVKLTVMIENESSKDFVFETVNPRPQTLLTPNFDPNSITLTSHRESTPVSMTFTGTIESDDIEPIEISVKNCEITLSDNETKITSEKSLTIDTYTELNDLNTKFENFKITALATSEVEFTVTVTNSSPVIFSFSNVNERPHTTLTVNMNDSVELTSHRVTENQQMTFAGTIESDDPVTVTIQPTKCKLNINGTEVNDGLTHDIFVSGSDTVDQINEKVNDIDITPLDTTGVTISITGNSSVLPEVKAVEHTVTFTTINPRPQTTLTITCNDTENSIQAQVASNIAIVLAGTIETDDLRSLTLTPNNCSFTNINDTNNVYTHDSPFTVEVFDIGTINSQLDNISLTATNTSDVTITATIDKVDEPTIFTFTNVTPAPVSNITAVTTTTESFNQSEETQNVQITVEGNFYTWDSKTVTVTPSGCTFTNVTNDDTSGTYTNVAPLTIANVANISDINNKLNNLSVTVTELNASITVAIADGGSQQVTLTVIPAVSISLGEYTPVNWGEYTTATAMTIGGHSLESTEVFPEVKITPTNCRFKGVTDSSETEYTNDSPYTVTATNLEELNGKLNAIQILTFGNSPKIEIESKGHTNSIEINSIEKDHELTVSCESLNSALTNGTESSAMSLVFGGTFVTGKTATVKITPNNCSFKGVTGDLETVYTNESPLTITATESVAELNSKVNTITVTPSDTTNVKLTVLIDDTPTELTFTNVSPA